jgi:tripartite-type tricarboxylate transporter receptor subunit TctC
MVHGRHLSTIAVFAALSIASLAPSRADPIADFYQGKTITIQIGFGVGGGYDTTARLFATYFGKHVPGNPTVVVQNMPGAGSMLVANTLYNTAPKDGTMLGVFASSTALEPLFGDKNARYDPRKFEWIGSLNRDIGSCGVWKGAGQGITGLPDLVKAKRTVTFGSTSPTAITSQHVLFLKNMFGANAKVIYGYKGTKDVLLAMMRGELDGTCGMLESSVRGAFDQYVKAGELNIFVQFGRRPESAIFRQCDDDVRHAQDRRPEACGGRHLPSDRIGPAAGRAARHAGRSGRGAAQGDARNHEGPRPRCGGAPHADRLRAHAGSRSGQDVRRFLRHRAGPGRTGAPLHPAGKIGAPFEALQLCNLPFLGEG